MIILANMTFFDKNIRLKKIIKSLLANLRAAFRCLCFNKLGFRVANNRVSCKHKSV